MNKVETPHNGPSALPVLKGNWFCLKVYSGLKNNWFKLGTPLGIIWSYLEFDISF